MVARQYPATTHVVSNPTPLPVTRSRQLRHEDLSSHRPSTRRADYHYAEPLSPASRNRAGDVGLSFHDPMYDREQRLMAQMSPRSRHARRQINIAIATDKKNRELFDKINSEYVRKFNKRIPSKDKDKAIKAFQEDKKREFQLGQSQRGLARGNWGPVQGAAKPMPVPRPRPHRLPQRPQQPER